MNVPSYNLKETLNSFYKMKRNNQNTIGCSSGCGAVGRPVDSDTRDLQFKSSHLQMLFTNNWNKTAFKRQKCNGPILKYQYTKSLAIFKEEMCLG